MIRDPESPDQNWGATLFSCGFRPFFLLGPLYGILILFYWAGFLSAKFPAPPSSMDALLWHKHEMFFGFVGAILGGFLLTAVQNWTKKTSMRGGWLAISVAAWLLGRFSIFFSVHLNPILVLSLDSLFLLLVIEGVARPILLAGNRRNLFVPMLLFCLFASNLLFHLELHYDLGLELHRILDGAQAIIVIFLVVIGNRVIPYFTRSAFPGLELRKFPMLEIPVHFALFSWALVSVFSNLTWLHALVGFLCSIGLLTKICFWKTSKILSNPMLGILHLGYFLLPIGFFMDACLHSGLWSQKGLTVHTFMAGSLSLLILGMITRVSLGHTARPIQADSWMKTSFLCMIAALIFRVILPLIKPETLSTFLSLSALFWILSFGIFLVKFFPILTSARLDGKPG